jgi:hypothetical protein
VSRLHPHRVIATLVVAVSLVALAGASIGLAAPPVFHSHENFTDAFADSQCDIPGTSVIRGVDNFTAYSNNTVKDHLEFTQTFTAAASGKSIVFHVAQQFTGNDQPIDNGKTVTFVGTFKGLPEQIRLANGRVLTRDAGRVTITRVFDKTTNALVSQTISGEKGPHPDLDSGFEVFCNVIVPALT